MMDIGSMKARNAARALSQTADTYRVQRDALKALLVRVHKYENAVLDHHIAEEIRNTVEGMYGRWP